MHPVTRNCSFEFDMTQAAHIELQTGGDTRFRVATWAVWLLAAACNLAFFRDLSWPLLMLSASVLIVFWPGWSRWHPVEDKLRMYRDGCASLSGRLCTWSPQHARATRWGMVIRLHFKRSEMHAIVCASRNHAQDYRRLLVWKRFPPFSPIT